MTSAVVYVRQELVTSHIDVLTSLRDPEIRRVDAVDGSVHHHHHRLCRLCAKIFTVSGNLTKF